MKVCLRVVARDAEVLRLTSRAASRNGWKRTGGHILDGPDGPGRLALGIWSVHCKPGVLETGFAACRRTEHMRAPRERIGRPRGTSELTVSRGISEAVEPVSSSGSLQVLLCRADGGQED